MEYKISVMKIIHDTIVDGVGFRTSIYCAGCHHHCGNCHNPESWDIDNGKLMSVQDIYNEVISNSLTNVTFTGGDPMFQAAAFYELARLIKNNTNKSIWCYTGFLFEDLVSDKDMKYDLLKLVDVLVEGKYIDNLRDISLEFRGSSNQRIINVPVSIQENKVIELII